MRPSFTPTLDDSEIRRRLEGLLVPGPLADPALCRRIGRLAACFASYAASYPLPLWAPGLAVSHEMRGRTEALFPVAPITALLALVLRRACRFPLVLEGSALNEPASWLDLAPRLAPHCTQADPAPLLSALARDGEVRLHFLFGLFLPRHFGAGFERYPAQAAWLSQWLRANRARLGGRLRALDSACGSGEGSYRLAELIRCAGFDEAGCAVHGSTIEPVELFAAAHAFFPHDPERQREFRARVAPLLHPGGVTFEFRVESVATPWKGAPYEVVLCNGLLGGPLLHDEAGLAAAFRALAGRLAPGGVLLAADRFHAGWRQRVPAASLVALLGENGLEALEVPEGIAGLKPL